MPTRSDPTYQRRGVENPAIIDLITFDREREEVVLVMIERRPWSLGQAQREQLNDKLNSYFTYVLDGHLLDQYPQYLGRPIRLELDCVEEPEGDVRGMLREATRVAAEHGLSFVLRLVAPEEIPEAPWERESSGEEPGEGTGSEEGSAPVPAAAPFEYRPRVLAALEAFGIRPRSTTEPERLRAFLNRLYVFEIRELRASRAEAERLFGPQPMEPYSAGVAALREKYALLGLPLEAWVQPNPASA